MPNPSVDFITLVAESIEIPESGAKDLEDLVERFIDLSPADLANYSGAPVVVQCCQFLCYAKRVMTLRRAVVKERTCFDRLMQAMLTAPANRSRKVEEEHVPVETA